jgi:tRNA dimethylallyltransferase
MSKLLIICGPTATGKTSLAETMAAELSGELISADSRQVYAGLDIVTGKDLPKGSIKKPSSIIWHDRPLFYYQLPHTRLWLTDIVEPEQDFNVSYWHECANLVIGDLLSRKKLPIIVGGTGLYIKSILENFSTISIPPNRDLRHKFQNSSAAELFNYLNHLNPTKAQSLNSSDRANPRRLIRAIEVASTTPSIISPPTPYQTLQIGLTAPVPFLTERIDQRVSSRLSLGALTEAEGVLRRYPSGTSSLTACGYATFNSSTWRDDWFTREKQYAKRQLTWFKKQDSIHWFDISLPDWQSLVVREIRNWYNSS